MGRNSSSPRIQSERKSEKELVERNKEIKKNKEVGLVGKKMAGISFH